MKKIFLTLVILIFASSAYAGSCPMLAGKVQNKIETQIRIKIAVEVQRPQLRNLL